MNNIIGFFTDTTRQPDTKFFRVRFNRSIMIPDGEGKTTSSVVGSTYDLPEAVAAEVDDAGEILGEVKNGEMMPKKLRIDPTAGIPPARETPAEVKKLPECFGEAFRLSEGLRVLSAKKDVLERYVARSAVISSGGFEYYHKKFQEARDAWTGFNFIRLGRLQFECSSAAVSAINTANELRDSVENVAREAFGLRLGALGLSETAVNRLFLGSALYMKFVREPLPKSEFRQAFVNGQMRPYIDVPVDTMIYFLGRAQAFHAELSALLVEANRELAAARKFSGVKVA